MAEQEEQLDGKPTGETEPDNEPLEGADTGEETPGGEPAADDKDKELDADAGAEDTKPKPATTTHEEDVKRFRDEAANAKGKLASVNRLVKALQDKGVLDEAAIEEAVTAAGMDPKAVKAILNQGPEPTDALQANAQRLLDQFGSPDKPGEIKLALDESYGEDTTKYFSAYDWLIRNDPAEKERLTNCDPRKVVSYAVKRGKEVFAEYEELQSHGGSLIDAWRSLKNRKPDDPAGDDPKGDASKSKQPKQRVPLNGSANATPPRASSAILDDAFGGR